jgi:hypothetical protein
MDQNFDEYARKYCVEGQLCFENIIDPDHLEDGIIGVRLIDNEDYEFLIDTETLEKMGVFVYKQSSYDMFERFQRGMQDVYNAPPSYKESGSGNTSDSIYSTDDGVPLPWTQITYIDTNKFNTNKMIVYPILDRARKAYRQLSLIEDAIIIYRLARAPERLVFNVSTGKLNKHRAEEEVLKLAKRYQTRRFYNPSTGTVSNDYDPHQLMESFFFPRGEDNPGTEVTSLQSGAPLSELPDLDYFQEKLYTSLKVPFTRKKDGTVTYQNAESMTYEEYRFAKFVVSHQKRIANGLLKSFRVHLELSGIWSAYGLNERDMQIIFTPPSSFELYEQQRMLRIRLENYQEYTNNEELSKEIAMKTCLGWTEDEIEKNNIRVEREKVRAAYTQFKVSQIEERGSYLPQTESLYVNKDENNGPE